MSARPASFVVKYRTVSITVFPWVRAGRTYWKFRNGKKFVVRADKDKARDAAKTIAQDTFLGGARLGALSDSQTRAIRRILEVDPHLSMVDEFLVWHAKRLPRKNSKQAIAEFLAVKRANAGKSPHNVNILEGHLALLPDRDLCDIAPEDLPEVPGSARTRDNKIASWVTFFLWCVKMGYLPYGVETAPQKLERPKIPRKIPCTWERAEFEKLVANVAPNYLPWLLISGFAGVRTEEICPDPKSDKSPLDWSDFKWERDLIIVRPETSKTGDRRVIPILPCLKAALWPVKQTSGRIGPMRPPHTPHRGGKDAETTRLGKFVGGWKKNASRHSFISYRAAQVGLAQAAMEAGNSEREARKSYNDAKGSDEAELWFSLLPVVPQNYLSVVKSDDTAGRELPAKPSKSRRRVST